jgi:hypothetical protein
VTLTQSQCPKQDRLLADKKHIAKGFITLLTTYVMTKLLLKSGVNLRFGIAPSQG